jgi:hypothetical protein
MTIYQLLDFASRPALAAKCICRSQRVAAFVTECHRALTLFISRAASRCFIALAAHPPREETQDG